MKSDLVFCFAARAWLNPYGKEDGTEAIKVYINFYYNEKKMSEIKLRNRSNEGGPT